MKKALALISALTFASAAKSDGFLSPDNELRIRPISYNPNEDSPLLEEFPTVFPRNFPRDIPHLVYVDDAEDDEQYVGFNMVQNWHYPLKPLPATQPYVPFPTAQPQQTQPQPTESNDNSLYTGWNIVQNWHYPLKPLPMNNPYVPLKPTPVQNQPQIEEDSALFDLGQMVQNSVKGYQKGQQIEYRKNEVRKIKTRPKPGQEAYQKYKKDTDDLNPILPKTQIQNH